MQPLLVKCEVSHVVGNHNRSRCWGCLNCRGGSACSQLLFCCVLFVSWSGFMTMEEGTEHFRHLLLLVTGRSIVVAVYWIVALRQWFVRWGRIPAWELINFNIESWMFTLRGELQYHTLSSPGLKFLASHGRWKRQSNLGFKWDK